MLRAEHLHWHTQGQHIVRDVSLHLQPGECVGLIGPNGSGKSSLLRLLYLAQRPSRGLVRLFGSDLMTLDRERLPGFRRRIGVVFQDFRLVPHLSAFDNIALPLRIAGMRDADITTPVREILDWVGLNARGDALPATLSGECQPRGCGDSTSSRSRLDSIGCTSCSTGVTGPGAGRSSSRSTSPSICSVAERPSRAATWSASSATCCTWATRRTGSGLASTALPPAATHSVAMPATMIEFSAAVWIDGLAMIRPYQAKENSVHTVALRLALKEQNTEQAAVAAAKLEQQRQRARLSRT